jgi:ABC-type Fe2+-enterobactin transport system substrate-binding protein
MLLLAPACFLIGQTNNACRIDEHYKVIALPLQPTRVNELGQVAGTTAGHRAALWTENPAFANCLCRLGSTIPKAWP